MKEMFKKLHSDEKGFTLVELIVVIVILAIMAAVSIGGVYRYVNESKKSTDIANAETIESTLTTLGTDDTIYRNAKTIGATAATDMFTVTWDVQTAIETSTFTWASGITDADKTSIVTLLNSLLTDGLIESKTHDGFTLTVTALDALGNIRVTCTYNDPAVTP